MSAASTTGVKLPVEVITLPVSWPGRRLAGLTVHLIKVRRLNLMIFSQKSLHRRPKDGSIEALGF